MQKTVPLHRPLFKMDFVRNSLFDGVFFLFPFWVSVAYFWAIQTFPGYEALIFLTGYVVLAETHFASTWMVYLDAKNVEYYRTRPMVYFGAPLLIAGACVLFYVLAGLPNLLLAGAIMSFVHVVRQSTGIVALYRAKERRGPVKGVDLERRDQNFSIYFLSLGFAMVGFERFYLGSLGAGLQVWAGPLIQAGWVASFGLGALFYLGALLRDVGKSREGQEISLSKWIVLTYSVLLYSPYVFASRMEHAMFLGVAIHYVQYLGIVWLVNRNKYPRVPVQEGVGAFLLGLLSQNLLFRFGYLLTYAVAMVLLRQGGANFSSFEVIGWFCVVPIIFQTVHYYIDAFLWKFSNPFVRKSVLPYLN